MTKLIKLFLLSLTRIAVCDVNKDNTTQAVYNKSRSEESEINSVISDITVTVLNNVVERVTVQYVHNFNASPYIDFVDKRHFRQAVHATGLHCLSCTFDETNRDNYCFAGETNHKTICKIEETCYTEIHPLWLKRGCANPDKVTRSIVCRCPLCNDKPASFEYKYDTLSDWHFDNKILQQPLLGIELICKSCKTGSDENANIICIQGKEADQTTCLHNQLCITNVHENGSVSRGCVDKPAFNSFFYFCNYDACNTHKHGDKEIRPRFHHIQSFQSQSRSSTLTTNIDINAEEKRQKLLRDPKEKIYNVTIEEVINNYTDDHNNLPAIKRFSDFKDDISELHATGRITTISNDSENKKPSCIQCSNIETGACNSPLGKEVPRVQCPNVDDLCYSQHTPFGVVNRGCYNMNSNVNVFVCSCNLCNYISFTEMPYIFSNHREWAKNVEELSRMIHFRKSIYKRMSCLSCSVNTTNTEQIDNDDNAYCLDGNVIKVPSTECPQDEICGVRSQRSTGYIWRGCLKTPLYNYWYALCDSDDCNNDQIVSLLNM